MTNSELQLDGKLTLAVNKRSQPRKNKAWEIFKWKVKHFFVQRWREMPLECLLLACRVLQKVVPGFNMPLHGRLYLKVIRDGEVWDYGHVGCHLIVTAGKNYLTGCFDNTNEAENLKYHGFGTGTTAAAAGDTGLQTEFTTEYVTNSTRPTGSQSKSSNVYTTVATFSPDSGGTLAVTEWGLFSASSSTTLFDRQVFGAVNLVSGTDSLQSTYNLTVG